MFLCYNKFLTFSLITPKHYIKLIYLFYVVSCRHVLIKYRMCKDLTFIGVAGNTRGKEVVDVKNSLNYVEHSIVD